MTQVFFLSIKKRKKERVNRKKSALSAVTPSLDATARTWRRVLLLRKRGHPCWHDWSRQLRKHKGGCVSVTSDQTQTHASTGGIADLAQRGDLADRALSFNLPSIPTDKRRSQREIRKDFSHALPSILGLLFAMRRLTLKYLSTHRSLCASNVTQKAYMKIKFCANAACTRKT